MFGSSLQSGHGPALSAASRRGFLGPAQLNVATRWAECVTAEAAVEAVGGSSVGIASRVVSG